LEQLRLLTKEKGIVLIFDEIITGFRYSLGGAQELFGVTPDLAAFGKAMGNGMPISAVVGSVKIMKEMEEIFFSGTFGGEALSLAAAIAVIDKMKAKSVIEHLWSKGEELSNQVVKLINKYSLSKVIDLSGKDPWKIVNFHDHEHGSKEEIKTLFMIEMLDNGVLTQGTHNICYAHTDSDIEHVVEAYDRALYVISDSLLNNTLRKNLNCSAISPVFQVRK
jgi:glutamate-1-semialdehyde 2,1-aminomutase/spore coat polysaccharide biosynthesis protein SpsF